MKRTGRGTIGVALKTDPANSRALVESVAKSSDGNIRRMAWALGISRQRLYLLLVQHRLWRCVNAARHEKHQRDIFSRRRLDSI